MPSPTANPSPDAPMQMLRAGRAGPGSDGVWSIDDARAYVERLTLGTYENFSVLSRLVPEDVRPDFAAVYAFCRWADDLADETHQLVDEDRHEPEPRHDHAAARARATELLAWWRAELDRCFAGEATHPVMLALAESAGRRGLHPKPFHDLIDAFEQDQRVTRYATWDQLLGYCSKSANPVGRIVLTLADAVTPDEIEESPPIVRQSDAICSALQLANFWQDVRRDLLERDRVYMPTDETGLDADTLRDFATRGDDPDARVPFIRALRPLVERTNPMFADLDGLARGVGGWAGPVIHLLGSGGVRTLRKIEAAGCTTLWKRPKLTKLDKAALVARASLRKRFAPKRSAA